MIRPKEKKQLLVQLICEDLVHQQLLSGLNRLGLQADAYSLNLSELVFGLMGYDSGTVPDWLYEHYLLLREEALCSITETALLRTEAEKQAKKILDRLERTVPD